MRFLRPRRFSRRYNNSLPRRGAAKRKLRFELLEDRRLLTTTYWDGASDADGDGVSWSDPFNWVGDALPAADHDVVIDLGANDFTVTTGGVVEVKSLSSLAALRITGGEFAVAENSTTRELKLTGGTLKSETGAEFTVTELLTLSGGTIDGVKLIQGEMSEGIWNGAFTVINAGSVENHGSVMVPTDDTWSGDEDAALHNYGAIVKNTPDTEWPAASRIGLPFYNHGLLDLQQGILVLGHNQAPVFCDGQVVSSADTELDLFGNGEFTASSSVDVFVMNVHSAPGVTTFGGQYRADSTLASFTSVKFGGQVEALGNLWIRGSTIDLTDATLEAGATTLPSLTFINGTLKGAFDFTVAGVFDASAGGTFDADGGQGSVQMPNGLTGATYLNLKGYTLVNPADKTLDLRGLSALDGSVLKNYGTLLALTDETWSGDATSALRNYGTLIKNTPGSEWPAATRIALPFYNHGLLDLQQGILVLGEGGDSVFCDGQVESSADTELDLFGPGEFTAMSSVDVFVIHVYSVPGIVAFDGQFRADNTQASFSSVKFGGQVEALGNLWIRGSTIDLTDATLEAGATTLASLTFINGTLKGAFDFTVSGVFDAASGGTLDADGGQGSLLPVNGVSGPASLTLDGYTLVNPADQTLDLRGLTALNGSALENYGVLLTVTHAAWVGDASSEFRNFGHVILQANVAVSGDGTTILNEGLFEFQFDAHVARGSGEGVVFDNRGTVRKTAGDGEAALRLSVLNTGTIEALVGDLAVGDPYNGASRNEGVIHVADGTLTLYRVFESIVGSEVSAVDVVFSGAYATLDGTYRAAHSTTTGGEVTLRGQVESLGDELYVGNGFLDVSTAGDEPATLVLQKLVVSGFLVGSDNFIVEGDFLWTGRVYGAPGTWIETQGTTTIDGYAMYLFGRNWTNLGQVAMLSGGLNVGDDGTTIVNEGLFEFQTDTVVTLYSGEDVVFDNRGIVRKSAGESWSGLLLSVLNTGTIEALVGDFTVGRALASSSVNEGVIRVDDGTLTVHWVFESAVGSEVSAIDVVFYQAYATLNGMYRAEHATSAPYQSTVSFNGQVENFGELYIGSSDVYVNTAGDDPATWVLPRLTVNGNLYGSDNFVVEGDFVWGGRVYGAPGTWIETQGTTTIDGYAMYLFGRNWTNLGQVAMLSGGLNVGDDGTTIVNEGLFEFQTDTAVGLDSGEDVVFENRGIVRKSAGESWSGLLLSVLNTGTIEALVGDFTVGRANVSSSVNEGVVRVDDGTLTIHGVFDSLAGSEVSAYDVVFYQAYATLNGMYRAEHATSAPYQSSVSISGQVEKLGKVYVANSTIDVSAAGDDPATFVLAQLHILNGATFDSSDNFVVTGEFVWNGGYLGGSAGTWIETQGSTELTGAFSAMNVSGRSWFNSGDVVWSGNNVWLNDGATFKNSSTGTFDDQTDGTFGASDDACPKFMNEGLFIKSGGDGKTFLKMELFNSGEVRIDSGILNIGCGYVQVIGSGDGSNSDGTISGDYEGDVSIENPGDFELDPDPTPPQISNFTQTASGTLVERIGGTVPGQDYGQIIATGTVNLDGALVVELLNGFIPQIGDEFTVIDNRGENDINGTFADLPEGEDILSGLGWFTVSYAGGDGNDLVLTYQGLAAVVTFDVESIAENAGAAAAFGTVTRIGDLSEDLIVDLASSDTSEATVPAQVTILAGQASATFFIDAIDDLLLDGTQTGTVTASAGGHVSKPATFQVTDHETLTVAISAGAIAENAGAVATTATVTRSNVDDLSQALVVNLASSDTSEATVAAQVTILAGDSSVTFAIDAVDDALLDATQTVTITASQAGYVGGGDTLDVTDHETLSVTFNISSIAENAGTNAATGMVSRSNTDDLSQALVVNLASSDTSEATVATQVTIAAGQASATFAINAIDDNLLDGTQTVTITASAAGFFAGQNAILVTDHETLTVSIVAPNIAENAGAAATTATVTRSNVDDLTMALVVNLASNDTSEAAVASQVTILAGQASATFNINAVDDALLDGTQTVTITASAAGYVSGADMLDVTDDETLSVSFAASSIAENAGAAATTATVSRSNVDDLSQPLTVDLANSDATEATFPAQVVIPAGEASVTFDINAVDDALLDGTQTVTITASAAGYDAGNDSFDVTDHETLTVTIDVSSIAENAGSGAATGTVSRSNTDDLSQALVVNLASSDTSEATLAAQVTILAGQASATFAVNAIDDNLFDGTQSVTITASAAGYFSGQNTVDVTDHETLSVVIVASSIAENAGSAATTATVTRSNIDDLSQALVVNLVCNDTSEATVPAEVTIPAGEASVTFDINAVDDALLDGTQTVTITASAAGYVSGADMLDVTDHEALTVSIDVGSISEFGGATTATITRSNIDDLSQALVVNLVSNDTSEATVPAQVTVPAGEASVTFDIDAVDDSLLDGTQTVSVTASAAGYVSGEDTLDVTDHETLTVVVNASSIAENSGAAATTATVTRSNVDDLSQPLFVDLSSSDATEASVPAQVTIPAGEASVMFEIDAVDDALLDGTQTVTFTVSAAGYVSGADTLHVTDHETLTVSIDAGSISEQGGATIATVSRSNIDDLSQALVVNLVCNDTSEATVPAEVTIPAGEASVTFDINAVDDALLDGTQTVTITATAAGYVDGDETLDVTDHETLVVNVPAAIAENAAAPTAGTVTRSNTDDLSQPLTVDLTSGDTSEATVPAQVTIPAGEPSVSFEITAVDDALLDGTQTVTITASFAGYVAGTDTVDVTDHETLSVVVSAASILENAGAAATTGTVTRSNVDDLSQALVVSLASNNTTEASVAATVTIPVGQASAPFNINAVDDALFDGVQSVTISVSAAGYVGASDDLTVRDNETKYFVVDAGLDDTFRYDINAAPILASGLAATNLDPRGVASNAADDRLWVIDLAKVFVYDAAGASLGSWKPKGLSDPSDIATNGKHVWIVDRGADKVFQYTNAASRTSGMATAAKTFNLHTSNKDAQGIVFSGGKLWVVDGKAGTARDKVFVYSTAGVRQATWTLDAANLQPTGITLDPSGASQDIWVVDAGTDRIYRYNGGKAFTSGLHTADASFALDAANTNPVGIADPPGTQSPANVSGDSRDDPSSDDLDTVRESRRGANSPHQQHFHARQFDQIAHDLAWAREAGRFDDSGDGSAARRERAVLHAAFQEEFWRTW